jgi:AbrB family looped-hinge helix DNA binding protein
MRITSKGQVTIPIEMREKLGLLPDSEVVFELERDSVRIRKAPQANARGRRLVARMRGTAGPGKTTDEIMALTRE